MSTSWAAKRVNWLCHETNLCRELGIPAVTGVEGIETIQQGERSGSARLISARESTRREREAYEEG